MNATNEKETADAIEAIRSHGGFGSVRQKFVFQAESQTMLGNSVTLVEVYDGGPGAAPRYIATATRPSDGKKAYSGRGETVSEAVAAIEWSHFST